MEVTETMEENTLEGHRGEKRHGGDRDSGREHIGRASW